MEFLLGAFVTASVFMLAIKFLPKRTPQKAMRIYQTQSKIFEIIKPAFYTLTHEKEPKPSQARNYYDKDKLTVLLIDDKAYWIKDNAVFEANVFNGSVDQENVKVVDTMGMDKVQLDRLSYIVDKLTKGDNNDRGYSGYQKF